MKSEDKWIGGAISATVVILALLIGAFWKLGLFNFTGTDSGAKIVASTLALVGSLIAALVSLVGLFLRQSIERRNADLSEQAEKRLTVESERNNQLQSEAERRLAIESERNAQLQIEAASRLKQEAAMRAIGLLSSSSGSDVPIAQRAGVLFTLAHLDLVDLAITLLRPMVENNQVDMNSAVLLINKALESDNELCQSEASEMLCTWPKRFLLPDGGNHWPDCVSLAWKPELSVFVRDNVALGLLHLLAARPPSEWNRGSFNAIVCTLYEIWRTDPNPHIKAGVGFCLSKALTLYEEGYYLYLPSGDLDLSDLRTKLEASNLRADSLSSLYVPIAKEFEKWSGEAGSATTQVQSP
jgi:hypothetical protein